MTHHLLHTTLVVAPLLFATATRAAAQDDWHRFRGPAGSGVRDSVPAPIAIDEETTPTFRTAIPFGRSSPIVVGDTIVLTASDDAHLLVCAVGSDGQRLWTRELERAHPDAERFKGNDSASCTPASDGTRIYAVFPELGLVALSLDGEVLWTHELPAFDNFYGMSASPVVAGDRIVLQCDQDRGSYVVAVDKETGEQAWRVERPGVDASWSTPVVREVDGTTEVVLFSSRQLLVLDAATGEERRAFGRLGTGPVCSPLVDGSRVFACVKHHAEEPFPKFEQVAAGFDKNQDGRIEKAEVVGTEVAEHFGWVDHDNDGALDAAEWQQAYDSMTNRDYGLVAFALEGDTGNGSAQGDETANGELWRYRRFLPDIATPIVYRGLIYLLKHGGVLAAIDTGSGDLVRRGRVGVIDDFYASPVASHGHLYLASQSGELVVVTAGADWKVASTHDLGEAIEATPAIGGDGSIYVRTAAALYRFR